MAHMKALALPQSSQSGAPACVFLSCHRSIARAPYLANPRSPDKEGDSHILLIRCHLALVHAVITYLEAIV